MRRDALIIFLIEWRQEELILRGKHPKYWRRQFNIKTKKMRRDAVIIFLIEWRQEELILRGKDLKYWNTEAQNLICYITFKVRFWNP